MLHLIINPVPGAGADVTDGVAVDLRFLEQFVAHALNSLVVGFTPPRFFATSLHPPVFRKVDDNRCEYEKLGKCRKFEKVFVKAVDFLIKRKEGRKDGRKDGRKERTKGDQKKNGVGFEETQNGHFDEVFVETIGQSSEGVDS